MWEGYSEELYQEIVKQRQNGERIDRVTTGGTLNQFIGGVSGGRIPMINNQLGQYLPLVNPETRQQMAGVEGDYAKGTADIRIESDEEVILHSIIPKFKYQPGIVESNSAKSVIYRTKTGQLAEVEIPAYYTAHTWACSTLHETDTFKSATPGDIFGSNEVIAHTRTRTKEGNLAMGRELNMTYLGRFGTNEDGVEVNSTALAKLESEKYEVTEIFLQGDELLLDIYGNNDDYRGLPIPGEFVKENGMVAGIRRVRRAFTPINMMRQNLKKPQHPFDSKYRQSKGMEIVEVEVYRDARGDFKHMPKTQVDYLDRLADNALEKHRRILEIDAAERRNKGHNYPRHPSFQIAVTTAERHLYAAGELPANLVKEAKIIPSARPTISDKTYTYYIRIVSKGKVKPTLGHKLTNFHGAKAVICAIRPPEEMPKDKWGRISDINANPAGVSNRNNPSQLIEGFKNDACFHTLRHLKTISSKEDQLNYLAEFYRLCSLETYRSFLFAGEEGQLAHLDYVLNSRIDITDEPGDPTTTIAIVGMLKDTPYYPPRGHVTYKDENGELVTSKALVRVANQHIFMLDKIGKYSSACHIAVRQALGFTAKLSARDKALTHISNSPSRLIGNTESRALFGNMDAKAVRYMLHTGNSVQFNRNQITKILEGELMLEPDLDTPYVSRGLEFFTSIMRTYGHDLKTGDE